MNRWWENFDDPLLNKYVDKFRYLITTRGEYIAIIL